MAKREDGKKNAAVCRSVSFKKLESWSANSSSSRNDRQVKSKDLDACGVALPPLSTTATTTTTTEQCTAEKVEPLATRNVGVSRKVSKITATNAGLPTADRGSSTPLSSLSPSIRQLTQKFSSAGSAGTQITASGDSRVTEGRATLPRAKGTRKDPSPLRSSFHEDISSGCIHNIDSANIPAEFKDAGEKLNPGTDSFSGSDSEKANQKWMCSKLSTERRSSTSKRDYTKVHPRSSDIKKALTTDRSEDVSTTEETPPACKSQRSYLSTRHGEFIPVHSDHWPSVTKIRQIFSERQTRSAQQPKATNEPEEKLKTGLNFQFSTKDTASLSDKSDKHSASSSGNEASSLFLPEKQHFKLGAPARINSGAAGNILKANRRLEKEMDFFSDPDLQQDPNEKELDLETHSNNNTSKSIFQDSSSGRSLRVDQPTHRAPSPNCDREPALRTSRTTLLTSDPDPDLHFPAPTPSPQSCPLGKATSSAVKQPRERRERQGVGLPRDSLHSSNSSSRTPAPTSSTTTTSSPFPLNPALASSTAAPSSKVEAPISIISSLRYRFSSGEEEEEHIRKGRGRGVGRSASCGPLPSTSIRGGWGVEEQGSSFYRGKHGWCVGKSVGRSSGSEEDSAENLGPPSRDAVRRRSLRKKKKVLLPSGRCNNDRDGESEDSDSDTGMTMEQLEPHHHQSGSAFPSRKKKEPVASNSRRLAQRWECLCAPSMATPLPGVSRVSKVNIPSFTSPGGSQSSSRCSSTETLKEEKQARRGHRAQVHNTISSNVSISSMQSKTYHGNSTMYRSPSFGHGDNFSRAPVWVRPQVVPTVTPPSTTPQREGPVPDTGQGAGSTVFRRTFAGREITEDKTKHRISMSNPDIASDTMTLLSFLKTDLSDLRVRKVGGEKPSGAEERSTLYRRGSHSHGNQSGCRPTLKDLTATLRRAKSFSYSDKSTLGVPCFSTSGTSKRSSSEQRLDVERDEGRRSISDREVESDGGDFRVGRERRARDYGYDDNDNVTPTPLQDRYIQEARQVMRDICQMSAREDDDDDDDNENVHVTDDERVEDESSSITPTGQEKERGGMNMEDEVRDREKSERDGENGRRLSSKRDSEAPPLVKERESWNRECSEERNQESREQERSMQKGDSEESMFHHRSVDELSGHESSLTDEGIVTEPETGLGEISESCFAGPAGVNLGSMIARDVLGKPVTTWKQSVLHQGDVLKKEKQDTPENVVSSATQQIPIPVASCAQPHALRAESDSIIMDMSSPTSVTNSKPFEAINTSNTESEGVSLSTPAGKWEGGLDAPATPGAVRRRRKFSPTGNNNSDCSNGSSGESTSVSSGNGEATVYRSLSDPTPQRRCFVAGEGNSNFCSMDSNLLGSLSVKGIGSVTESCPATVLSESKGSVASDLSVCSDSALCDDSVRDYSGVIRSIVAEPGAMDRLMVDDHGNGKAPKKKSFSDPSRRSDAQLLSPNDPHYKGHSNKNEPISELEQAGQIPPSSSEPILSGQREKLWNPEGEAIQPLPPQTHPFNPGSSSNKARKSRSSSECALASENHGDEDVNGIDEGVGGRVDEGKKFNFDLKPAEALSPRLGHQTSRKHHGWSASDAHLDPGEPDVESQEDLEGQDDLTPPLPPLAHLSRPETRTRHVRHASEPATFMPISPPAHSKLLKEANRSKIPPTAEPSLPSKPSGDEAPSLEDVTKRYILALSSTEKEAECPGPLSGARDGTERSMSVPEGPSETPTCEVMDTGAQRTATEDPASLPPIQRTKPKVDMRRHVIMTLLDTEQSYVDALRTLIQGYMRPLKQPDSSCIVDPLLVDEMFYQIPEILEHHETFLEQVTSCVSQWHDRQTVGHLLIQSFSKETLANIYSAYIDNFLNAKDAVRIAKEAKPAFLKFLEQSMRENREKQALGDLMIKPVQRIPRYELLVKDLLKHTPEEHPDHPYLLDAQRGIKRLAEKINKGRRSAEEAERETRVMQEIEAHIEGVEHIMNPQRKFLRQEMVMEGKTVGGRKDRSLFLFTDLLICTTLKRKSGSLRRSSMSLYSAASLIDTSSKYKFLWKLSLEDIEMVKNSSQATNKENIQKMIGRLDEDLNTLGQISKLSETLSFPHQSLDEVIKDLMASVHRELSDKQSLAFSMTFLPTKLEFATASAESSFLFEFSSPDARSNFEQAFEDAKKKLAMNKDQWDPEFLKAIPIMKTRSGMQFSCASPSHSCPDSGCEVWVCNSDGYVGQVCLLNIKDEPTVEACIAVCSARIICIAAVPGLKGRDRGVEPAHAPPPASSCPAHPQPQLHISISHSSLELSNQPAGAGAEIVPFDSDDTDDEDSPSPSSTLQSQASRSTISSSYGNEEGQGLKDMATETTSSEEEQEFPAPNPYGTAGVSGGVGAGRVHPESPMDGRAMRRSSRGSFTRASLEDLLSIDPEAYQSSVWLGTEDGCIHVYQSSDNIRNRKNSMKIQHSASILCILYLDNKVFVSLANGDVIVYQREAGSFWDAQSSQTLGLGTASSPITKMVPVGGKLWCGSQNRVLVINTSTLVQEHWFQVGTDSSRCVTCMVAYGQGVWLALQGSALVRLYHAQTWESLTEVDVAPAVHKMLAGADAIIRQHKAACLRITALLACKDLLWIGTSAGVVLTLAIPVVSSGTGAATLKSPLVPMGSAHGHTGHVRFLTSIEFPEGFDVNFPKTSNEFAGNQSQGSSADNGGHGSLQRRDSTHHVIPKTNHLVISGGDGYEDFRLTNSSETVGRDDSTNHLLLWRV
ncbi:rho guanine nucleotide exchange factor 17 [Gadus morhua]|uniref:Rho guanine nucleotide exchange factor (GEF) 17 n=1 Tax=Gadus morhua TaxID=8049 RepID=A0A8C4ZC13_GADMO|nr:rho guanine nucleotide exchange factor 17 [Gadus morhua]